MASYEKRGGKWCVRFRECVNGVETNRRLSGFATKKDAEKAWKAYTGKAVKPKSGHLFEDAYEEYLESLAGFAESTIAGRRSALENCFVPFHGKSVEKITKEDVLKWQAGLLGRKAGGIQKMRSYLSLFLEWCKETYGIPNVMQDVKPPHVREAKQEMSVWTEEEFRQFLSVTDGMWKTLFMTLFYGGLRIGEALALTASDIKKDGGRHTVTVNKSMNENGHVTMPKTKNSCRRITLPAFMNESIEALPKDGRVFPVSRTAVHRRFEKAVEESGVKRIRIHDLRHSHATMLIHEGVPVTSVSKHLGHANVSVTMKVYSHAYESYEEEVASALEGTKVGTKVGTKI